MILKINEKYQIPNLVDDLKEDDKMLNGANYTEYLREPPASGDMLEIT